MSKSEALKDIRILYVEDDAIVRTTVKRFLKRRFNVVHEAGDGLEGLNAYKESHYDIIITDINMPIMDGLQLIKSVLEINEKQSIIITTAYNDEKYKCTNIVCKALIKPIDNKKLLEAIQNCIKLKD